MNTLDAIRARRSIRKFKPDPIPRETIETILEAGINAPSAKNRQPWRFVVVTEKTRGDMLEAMRQGLEWMDQHVNQTEEDRMLLKGAWRTYGIMAQAPVTIFILNPYGKTPFEGLPPFYERFGELANVQSVGAAIQNMCLAATDQGVGSLWICDVFSAYQPLTEWLDTNDQLVAALSLGYADEAPNARPRKPVEELAVWR